MIDYKLGEAPGCTVQGQFDDSCRLRLSTTALKAMEHGRLRLKLSRHGPQPAVKDLLIDMAAASGVFDIHVGSSATRVSIGDGVTGAWDIRLWREACLTVGAGSTSNGVRIVCDRSEVQIGEDCMFSTGILIQSADQHGIVDLRTGQIINNRHRETRLGNHVWLGRNSTVMGDVTIGEGAIIGAGSVVTKPVPAFTAAAGVPARVVRTETTWSRSPVELDAFASLYCRQAAD